MKSIISQGLKLSTECNYIKFTESKSLNLLEDKNKSVFEIKFPKGFHGKDIIDRRIKLICDCELQQTDFIKIINPVIDLNGCKFKKLNSELINFNQFIVKDIDKHIVTHDNYRVTILIPESKIEDKCTYLKCIESIPYFELINADELCTPTNIYNINLSDKNFTLDSKNGFVFATKKFYDRYQLRMIDIIESFITKLESRLEDFGIQLVGLPFDENQLTNNYVLYRINDLGSQQFHKTDTNELRYAVKHKTSIGFELTVTDMSILNDFSARYQNIDLISNFTEFYTKDRTGSNWLSAVQWGPITTDFVQDFNTDSSGNFAFTANFNCDIYYYIVFDNSFKRISEIVNTLVDQISGNIVNVNLIKEIE